MVSVEASNSLTADNSPGDLREPSPSLLTALGVTITHRQLSVPLPLLPGGADAAASRVCSGGSVDVSSSAAQDLISAVAAQAGVPASWVSLSCFTSRHRSSLRALMVSRLHRPCVVRIPEPVPFIQFQIEDSSGAQLHGGEGWVIC